MSLLIARQSEAERVFPPITPDLYQSRDAGNLTRDQRVAVQLLNSSQQLTKLQKYLKGKGNGRHCLKRALFLHCNAFKLELAGQFQRADFFWQELSAELASVFGNESAWPTLAKSLAAEHAGLQVLSNPITLRARFIEEVLMDVHAAFFNGYVKQTNSLTLDNRAWKHLGYLFEVLEWSEWSAKEKYRLIQEAAEAEIHLLEEDKSWKEVPERCKRLIPYCTDSIDYEEHVWNANLSERVNFYRIDKYGTVGAIKAAIRDLEQLLKGYPLILPLYEKLGTLNYDLAVNLAKEGNISQALVEAQRAAIFSPSDEHAAFLVELTQLMKKLQGEAREYDFRDLRFSGNGAFLLDEVRIGFRPLEEYKNSEEPGQTTEALTTARSIALWRRIGLPKPSDRLNERAAKLLAAVDRIVEGSPSTLNEVIQRWHQVTREDQELMEIDHERVINFLAATILKCETTTPAERKHESTVYVLEVATTSLSPQAAAPFDFWLMSGRDMRLKVQTAAAIVLLFVAGAAFLVDLKARRVREASYQSVLQGSRTRNYLQVIDAAETFLSHPLVVSADTRDAEVIEQYNKALVLWIARQPGQISADVATRVERYRQLVGKS